MSVSGRQADVHLPVPAARRRRPQSAPLQGQIGWPDLVVVRGEDDLTTPTRPVTSG